VLITEAMFMCNLLKNHRSYYCILRDGDDTHACMSVFDAALADKLHVINISRRPTFIQQSIYWKHSAGQD